MMKKWNYVIVLLALLVVTGCTNNEVTSIEDETISLQETKSEKAKVEEDSGIEKELEAQPQKKIVDKSTTEKKDIFAGYKLIQVAGGNLSGHREANVVVNIGFGKRQYWAFTNEYGQLVRVIADKIILQNDKREPVTSTGRYYSDEAKVPGVERSDLDEGHIIADSLGGVSNAYNITPQDSTLNRHGDQAYMERVIRDAGTATDFEAIITYPNKKTQIPSTYKYTYTIRGNKVVDTFRNGNPDQANAEMGLTTQKPSGSTSTSKSSNKNTKNDIASVDINGNGMVTIAEAKAAGYAMPITKDHWLYPYMRDNDHDGLVGE
ncbi:DNA/RNA non-specific endonuclease [Kurthia sibirica]|nr:DNA/RNA non-specific endonuclease [Kurthia sibirica]GEK32896.1 hypothetical protein KSI01_04290 [Kurthia sibirica]